MQKKKGMLTDMQNPKVFIDGREGTTGLRIYERLSKRSDIDLITLPEELRKNKAARKKAINESDITFLCLPDAAAIEAVSLVEKESVRIIDASTAHRVNKEWAYGFPEMSKVQAEAIVKSKRISNPGCYATGFISIVKPLIDMGLLAKDSFVTCHALSGFSGAGKTAIADYGADDRPLEFGSPRHYALGLSHKHIPEICAMTGLTRKPIFMPMICDYYSGMAVTIPLFFEHLQVDNVKELYEKYKEFYLNQPLIKVNSQENLEHRFLGSNNKAGKDDLEIFISGNDDQVQVTAQFDNLGKGASGAAVQCMNLMLGKDPTTGLDLEE